LGTETLHALVKPDKDNEQADLNPPKILATAVWDSSQLAPRTGAIISAKGAAMASVAFDKWEDQATQNEVTAKLAKVLNRDTIDWSKEIILLVEVGQKNTDGYTVEVTLLSVKKKTLVVKWRVNEPEKYSKTTAKTTCPGVLLLCERFEGNVIFDPPLKCVRTVAGLPVGSPPSTSHSKHR
jgi:hypothetical protein